MAAGMILTHIKRMKITHSLKKSLILNQALSKEIIHLKNQLNIKKKNNKKLSRIQKNPNFRVKHLQKVKIQLKNKN